MNLKKKRKREAGKIQRMPRQKEFYVITDINNIIYMNFLQETTGIELDVTKTTISSDCRLMGASTIRKQVSFDTTLKKTLPSCCTRSKCHVTPCSSHRSSLLATVVIYFNARYCSTKRSPLSSLARVCLS